MLDLSDTNNRKKWKTYLNMCFKVFVWPLQTNKVGCRNNFQQNTKSQFLFLQHHFHFTWVDDWLFCILQKKNLLWDAKQQAPVHTPSKLKVS
jgi:hypothetical protein